MTPAASETLTRNRAVESCHIANAGCFTYEYELAKPMSRALEGD